MKKIKLLIPLFLALNYASVFSQQNITSSIINPFQKDALFREKVFLHVNKSVYFTNENIWFTAYVAEDADNKPSIYTSNLHINLIDFEGNLIKQKTIFIKNGLGNGDFSLDNSLKPGEYFIQGFTNYMRNFGEENVFIQEIEIINPALKNEISQNQNTNNYDIQLFPESGYLLEGVKNVVGIKALINGHGFPFTGKIINAEKEEITKFTGNRFGMGKCNFIPYKGEKYTAIIAINNTIQKIELPKANKTGIIFSLDNTDENYIALTLKTNIQTLPTLQKSNLLLLLYRNNYISQAVSLSLINTEQTTQKIVFDKNNLLNGVNIVTLFKDNQPIAERKFFINKLSKQTAILINKLKTENDSINFKIKTLNSNLKPVISQLSISVLPKNAKNFHENQTIKSAFLLTPYIKGSIENPSYYFKNGSVKESKDLDLLLLNQGWSTYTLDKKIKEINPKEKFKFERGFTLNGKIKWHPKKYNIGIISKKGRLVASSEINKDRLFSFDNVFVFKNDTIKVALIRNKHPLIKPTKVSFIKDTTSIKKHNFITSRYLQNSIIKNTKEYSSAENLNVKKFKTYPKVEVLKQIVLKTVKSKRKRNFYDDEMNLANLHNVMASGFYKNHKVTERMGEIYLNLLQYFRQLGMVVGTCPNCILKLRGGRRSFNVGGKQGTPNVFINDVKIDSESQIDFFNTTLMEDVDEILINRSGAGGGIDGGAGGIVKVYLKKANDKYYKYGKTLYKNLISLIGYDKTTNYYKPQYNIYTKEAYNWTEIDWKNAVKTNEKGEVIIKIPTNEFSNEFQFIINGFSENGLLFNTIYKTGKENTF
ncbi:hypothetical protein [Lutibacter sp.]|uniref:hypothetical protein n=1 Tax=Lutibacter sp. TaxID=1925666 RepID=UPI0025C2A6F7|nr:hypothetical protein [Lutibacter sp.]MCF6182269.1 hypothetical protein [Lutibacter sp.]